MSGRTLAASPCYPLLRDRASAWDNQGPTPHQGDWRLFPWTAYAIEGNVKVPAPEGDRRIQIKLEQSAVYDGETVWYLAGRQTRWHVVR